MLEECYMVNKTPLFARILDDSSSRLDYSKDVVLAATPRLSRLALPKPGAMKSAILLAPGSYFIATEIIHQMVPPRATPPAILTCPVASEQRRRTAVGYRFAFSGEMQTASRGCETVQVHPALDTEQNSRDRTPINTAKVRACGSPEIGSMSTMDLGGCAAWDVPWDTWPFGGGEPKGTWASSEGKIKSPLELFRDRHWRRIPTPPYSLHAPTGKVSARVFDTWGDPFSHEFALDLSGGSGDGTETPRQQARHSRAFKIFLPFEHHLNSTDANPG